MWPSLCTFGSLAWNSAWGKSSAAIRSYPPPYRFLFPVELDSMPEDTDLDPLGPTSSSSPPPSTIPRHSVKDSPEEPPNHEMDRLSEKETSSQPVSSPHLDIGCSQKGGRREVPTILVNGHVDGAQVKETKTPNGHVISLEEEHSKSEEEKIKEYLERSDTAVIFPEPVDGEAERKHDKTPGIVNDGANMLSEYLKCPQCERSFSGGQAIQALRDHLSSVHSGGSTEQKPELKTYGCGKCSACFAQKEQLEKHEALHPPSVQSCNVCNKSFANVYRLQRHMISHDESTVLRKFKCPECGKAFKFKHHLKEHIRIHSGEKPFACPNCGKRFSHSGSYSSHMTSKKCLVMNLKVRKIDAKSPRGRGSNHNNVFRPIIPKYGAGGESVRPASYMPTSERIPSFEFSPPRQQPSVVQPFLPAPYTSLSFHPLLASHFQNSSLPPPPPYVSLAGFHDVSHLLCTTSHQGSAPPHQESLDQDNRATSVTTPTSSSCGSLSSIVRTSVGPSNYPLTEGLPSSDAGPLVPLSVGAIAENRDLNAVKKILEIVDATVSKQQLELCPPRARNGLLPELLSASPVSRQSVIASCADRILEDKERSSKSDSCCRYCSEFFESKIDLHQHERYLCRLNRELQHDPTNSDSDGIDSKADSLLPVVLVKQEPLSSLCENQKGSCSEDGDHSLFAFTESDDDHPKDDDLIHDRKFGLKSAAFSEDQLLLLKAHYEYTPKPKKCEVAKLAKEFECNPRIIQMWFQRMRAQDRRFHHPLQEIGIPSEDKIAAIQRSGSSSPLASPSQLTTPKYKALNSTPFSPVFSHYNGSIPSHRQPTASALKGSPPGVSPCGMTPVQIQCLTPIRGYGRPDVLHSYIMDCEQPLDLSVKNKHHKTSGPLNFSPSATEMEGEVLNLSQKSSRTSTPLKEANHSVAVGDMRHDLISGDLKLEGSALYRYMQTGGLLPGQLPSYSGSSSPVHDSGPLVIEDEEDKDDQLCDYRPRSLMVHGPSGAETSPYSIEGLRPPSSSDAGSREDAESSGSGLENKGSPSFHDEDGNLENDVDGLKMRKIPWKQMDTEESHSTLESSPGPDDDPTKRKKQWKKQKIENEEGSYSCDQCEKTFNKQSSLARHKYEHSGQRPHKCDVCSKAFKHKHHLTEHKRLHSGEKPFQCKKCLKRFSHSGSYSQHMNHRYSYCKPYRQ